MKNKIINKETAILAKELGFNVPVSYYYHNSKDIFDSVHCNFRGECSFIDVDEIIKKFSIDTNNDPLFLEFISAPDIYTLHDWIHKNTNFTLHASFETIDDSERAFIWVITEYVKDGVEGSRCKDSWDFYKRIDSFDSMSWHKDYDECLKAGIYNVLYLMKRKIQLENK